MVINFEKYMTENTVGNLSSGRKNNFNLLRAIAAVLVIFAHSYGLAIGESAKDPLKAVIGISFGTLAVSIFFVTSGFLVFKSFVNKPLTYYIQSRILRIFPGLLICNLITVTFIGLFVTTNSFHDFFLNTQTYKYILNNTILIRKLEFFLPGTFESNIFPDSVNGSLWTLPTEIFMYIFIPILVLLGLHKNTKYYNILFLITFLILIYSNTHPSTSVYFQFYFLLGIFIFLNRNKIILNHLIGISIFLSIVLLYYLNLRILVLLFPFFIGYLVFYFSYCFKGILLNYNRLGDYSYGLYIYAFPVQQTILYFFKPTLITLFIYSFLITLILAIFSWHVIEKPMMKLKNNTTIIEKLFHNIKLISI